MNSAKASSPSENEVPHTASTILRALIVAAVASSLMAAAGEAGAGEEVPVVLHAVVCSADALDCRDVDTRGREFANMDACEVARQDLLASSSYFSTAIRPMLLARCRYAPWAARQSTQGVSLPHKMGRMF